MQQASDRTATYLGHGALSADVACRRCGYNLRGLRDDGRCPECGTPIGLSTQGDLLRFADPDWLFKIALGLKIILWMILVKIVIGVSSILIGDAVLAGLLWLSASCASFVGVWLMTEPDPSGIGEDPNLTARRIIRIALFLGIGGEALRMIADYSMTPGATATLLGILGVSAVLISLAGEFAKFVYYARLAARVPDDHSVRRANFLRWAYTITFGFLFVGGMVFGLSFGAAPVFRPTSVFICAMTSAGIAFIVFSFTTLILLFRLRRAIADQALLARRTWAAADHARAPTVDSERHRR